jgi:hypothetical protein
MQRIYVYIISVLFTLIGMISPVLAQDTIEFPLKLKIGFEIAGPVEYYTNNNILKTEGFISADLDEKRTVVLSAGFVNYKYSQYNYDYLNKGYFLRAGVDFNLLKPEKSHGRYWAGIGFHYGISRFTSEIPTFSQDNYWGTTTGSIPTKTSWGHFLEATPGIKTEIFKNVSIGWSISLRMLLYSGTEKDLRPIYFPGFGSGGKKTSTEISYWLTWNIPFKKIRVITKKPAPEETDESGDNGTSNTSQPPTGIRQ